MPGLAALRKLIGAAACAGVLAGILLTAVQQLRIAPLLLEAEVYEQAGTAATKSSPAGHDIGHSHDASASADGLNRTLLSAAANVTLAFGFAMLLAAAMFLSSSTQNWRAGLTWGLAGYAVFFIAPSLGLPPEVPGTQAAGLIDRQLWWLLTVLCTGGGLWLLILGRRRALALLGITLIVAPHLIGAPQPQLHGSTAPMELTRDFMYAAFVTNLVFWLSLGGLLGLFLRRMAPSR